LRCQAGRPIFAETGGMMNLFGRAALGVVVATVGLGQAEAKPAFTTKYVYYSVGGDTPEAIYKAMLSRGPRVNGAKAYAATSAVSSQDGKLLQAASCRIEDYQLKIDFEIKLPKIRNEKVLAPADRNRWKDFTRFLRRHEETHRSIWLGCAADLERKVKSLRAATCAEADKKAASLWETIRKACARKHDAFDAAEQKRLLQHPFVRLVYRRSLQTHAAKAP